MFHMCSASPLHARAGERERGLRKPRGVEDKGSQDEVL
jgi:hypothetical protein